jgi:itaconyl-CoA hydratase
MSVDAAALTGRGNYYEDFNVGDVYEHARGKTMEALENVLITNLVMNTAQLHFNEELAEQVAAQKHRIVFGGVTASLVIGLAMQDTGEQAVEEVGLDKVRFRVSVIHGDTLHAFTEVLWKDDSPELLRGHKNVGLVHFRHLGVNQRGETVFEGERRVLIKKRSFSTDGLEASTGETAPAMRAVRAVRARAVRPVRRGAVKAAKPAKAAKKIKPARSVKPKRMAPRKKRR